MRHCARCCVLRRTGGGVDLALVIADGLSARAIEQNAAPFLERLYACLAPEAWSLAPPVIVNQGRVAVGDEVGALLGARAVLVPGLYLTWAPRVGRTDAERKLHFQC
jgi:ethanolamine ammonia-lyase small subunit